MFDVAVPRLEVDATLQCQECPTIWDPADATRWRAYLTSEPPLRLILYCPTCAEREFGEFGYVGVA